MLQIDDVYEFLFQELFKDSEVWYIPNGVPKLGPVNFTDLNIFTQTTNLQSKIFFYDQEPFLFNLVDKYIKIFRWPAGLDLEDVYQEYLRGQSPYSDFQIGYEDHLLNLANPNRAYKNPHLVVISERSSELDDYAQQNNLKLLYYFFHGFAALDWYRGYYALNYSKSVIKHHKHDFISFNRLITNDRSYRIYFISLLKEQGLLKNNLVSFNVTDETSSWEDEVSDENSKLSESAKLHIEKNLTDISKLVIDSPHIHGSASASIPRVINRLNPANDALDVDAFWHVVTETVFYYNKLHLTEKIFKPIVSRQPFMLLAAPGNLAYLRSYGFQTFGGIIDETYDTIQDNDKRIEAVVAQLSWYCSLSDKEKTDVIRAVEPIVLHNFHHFYSEFKHIITRELLDNTKTLFQSIGYDDSHIQYDSIYHVLAH